ncbi:MAG TPA: gluconate 2-dehydrogenase subunit 3 family protein, partial [Vicinamibacteria bacterium]|nr:gluconate 2-dehydrogenase subunit 3 family protein [Vicinamibacteria bacterium]
MDDPYAVDRRGFLKTGAVAAAAAASACGRPASRWRVLSEDEAATLGAACDRIVPPDEDPGASQAGVVSFIDRQLATRQKKSLAAWQAGVRALDATARRRHGRRFAELLPGPQDEILQAMQEGSVYMADWQEVDPTEFFHLLHG